MGASLPSSTPVICGPTAGGKSDLAVDLALSLRARHGIMAEIVTADAFQVYRGLDIGTAKPTVEERRGVVHHLIDIVPGVPSPGSPALRAGRPDSSGSESRTTQIFTLDDWLRLAKQTIADLRARNFLPIVVGGTHLYVKGLLEGLFEGPEPDHALRAELAAMDPAARRAELERVDPAAAARIHPNDVRRTVRALEVFRLTGTPISSHQSQWDRPSIGTHGTLSASEGSDTDTPEQPPLAGAQGAVPEFLLVVLDWDSEALSRRINARVKAMMDRGLLDEVRRLVESNAFTPQSAEALGYKQLIPVVRAALDASRWPPPEPAVEEAVERIKIETRRFAKNQRTWLRRLSVTPGAVRLGARPADEAGRTHWPETILTALGLPR
ncbi:MAG TPA: tRNA (adenosine(37)-N6)-dimethylallyltransferase MiaA [Phycisphaerales bacterium]|nr:tRNA (adenosine(37)-N6)-dimethylallyltransferase MiaA [Phycisphaerales bacterium]